MFHYICVNKKENKMEEKIVVGEKGKISPWYDKGLGQPEPQIHACDSTKYIASIDPCNTIKTLKEWEESDLDLDAYLGEEPAEIDEDLADYIRDCTTAHYCSEQSLQGGDPITTNELGDSMYITVSFNGVLKKIMYLGILPEFG